MEKELTEFKLEVLTKLAVIENKLDGYNKIQEVSVQADNRSKQNEQDIREIKETNKWAFRTAIGAVITSIVGLAFIFINTGLGVN